MVTQNAFHFTKKNANLTFSTPFLFTLHYIKCPRDGSNLEITSTKKRLLLIPAFLKKHTPNHNVLKETIIDDYDNN